MHTFLPQFLKEKYGCTLYMSTVITYHEYNNLLYNAHEAVDAHYAQQNMVNAKIPQYGTMLKYGNIVPMRVCKPIAIARYFILLVFYLHSIFKVRVSHLFL